MSTVTRAKWFAISCAVLTVMPSALAQMDLFAPFSLENAQVLPKGVRNPRFLNFFLNVENKFDNAGVPQPLGSPLSKNVTGQDALNGQKTTEERAQLMSRLQANGYDGNVVLARTTGDVASFADIKVPALAMGVTERWTMAVAVPVMNIRVNADTGVIATPEGQSVANSACEPNSAFDCNETVSKFNNPVANKLADYGYLPVGPMTISSIGDVQLISKYSLYKDDVHAVALKNQMILPTGIGPNADRALDVPTGSARVGVGAGLIYDRQLPSDFRWNAYGNAIALMPNRMQKRIPTSSVDTLSPVKEEVSRRLGGQFAIGTAVDRKFFDGGLVVGAGYSLQHLTRMSYEAGAYDPSRYEWLADQKPAQTMHAVSLTAGFSTVDWYKQKRFALPLQANFTFTRPFMGQNVNATDLLAGELVLFF